MQSWGELLNELGQQLDPERSEWLGNTMTASLANIGALRGTPGHPRNVLLYGSAFLQKSSAPPEALQITFEDINGLMATMYGRCWNGGLTLILHSPAGITNATETLGGSLR